MLPSTIRVRPALVAWMAVLALVPAVLAHSVEEQPPAQPARPPTTTPAPRRSNATRRPTTRLASVPNMFGDFFGGGPLLTATFDDGRTAPRTFSSTLIAPGGGRR